MYNSVQYINQTYYSVFTGYRTRPLDKYIYLYPVLCSIRSIRSQVLDDFTNAGNQNTQAPQSANRQPIRKSWNFFHGPIHWMRGCHPCLPPPVGCGFPQTVDIRLEIMDSGPHPLAG